MKYWSATFFTVVSAVIFFLVLIFGLFSSTFRMFVDRILLDSLLRITGETARSSVGTLSQDRFLNAVEMERLRFLERENVRLKEMLNLRSSTVSRVAFTARIIGMSPDRTRGFLFIDRGVGGGIAVGDIAFVGQNIVVGRIVEVYDDFAVLETPLTRGIRIAARLSTSHALVPGIFENEFGVGKLNAIPKTSEVSVGDGVVTSGQDGVWPAGFLLGIVASAEVPTSSYFWNIKVELPWHPAELEEVFIAKNPLR